ncbi:MAG: outer membrane protein TOM13-domain-containing protein [Benniella sp.]|nr:MAG: outer membrane protein TOM13-domain-containing protein [Benniella sp.]
MSSNTQDLHDPATQTRLEDSLDDNDGASSGILLDKADYDHSSPEVSSLNSSAILVHPDDNLEHGEKDATSLRHGAGATVPDSASASRESSTAIVDLNKTMPWKLLYPIASRETIIALCKATAINLILPFINGVFLGFGEICAHELAYRWGWINSAHVVNAPGRPGPGSVGIRAAGQGSGFGSRSGIGGGLGEDEHELGSSNRTKIGSASQEGGR